ncbi:MAG: hypothetical protein PHS53_01595 [Candidatus Pacebacteria bacterium]|nr:hypothetical protein [Candidatus Paceibacterota bacterium]
MEWGIDSIKYGKKGIGKMAFEARAVDKVSFDYGKITGYMKSALIQKAATLFLSGLILLCLVSLSHLTASAEIIAPENSVSLSIQPQNPEPNSEVSATIEGYLFDLQKSKISWSVNGNIKKTGIGGTTFSFTTGNAGKTTNLSVVVDAPDGTHVEKLLSLQAANVDLAWEATSYSPPFYKGKSLFPPQGTAKVVALPDLTDASGNLIPAEKLLYKWTKDREILGDDSGYGKNIYTFTGDLFSRPVTIKVEASTLVGNQTAEKSIVISPATLQVVLYEDDPLLGITYEKSLPASFPLINPEIKMVGVPYFFNANDPLTFSWSMNGSPFTDGQSADGKSATLRQNSQTGTAVISLGVTNSASFLQSAETKSSIFLPTITKTNATSI